MYYSSYDMIQRLQLTATAGISSRSSKSGAKKTPTSGPGSPTLPLLPAHSHQPIEQLLPQLYRRNLMRLPHLIHNLQPVRHRLARRPSNHNLRLPAQSTHLLQFPDIRNRHREPRRRLFRFQTGPVGGFGGEGNGGNVNVCGDVDPAFAALVAALEVDRAGYFGVVGFWENAEVVFGVPRASYGARFINAEFGLYARFGGAFEETEDVLAVPVFLLFCFMMLVLRFSSSLVGIFMYCLMNFFM